MRHIHTNRHKGMQMYMHTHTHTKAESLDQNHSYMPEGIYSVMKRAVAHINTHPLTRTLKLAAQ